MNKALALIEVQRLCQEFAASRLEGNELLLQHQGFELEETEFNQKLTAALQAREDARPILHEYGKFLLDRAALLDRCAEKDALSANLCRQSAEAVKRFIAEIEQSQSTENN